MSKTGTDLVSSVTYGTLLGDGSISMDRTTYCLSITHCAAQLEYLQWKAHAIGHIGKIQPRISGYGAKMFGIHHYDLARLNDVYHTCITDGKKKVTPEWLQKLDPISLAVWYQDDGSWGKAGSLRRGQRSQRKSAFSACSFDRDSISLLQEWLLGLGLKSRFVIRKNKYPMIELYHSATIKLWKMVAPYLVIKSKVDIKKRLCGKYWIDPKIIGVEAKKLSKITAPPKIKIFRYKLSKNTRLLVYKNESHHLNEWSRIIGQKRETISNRIKRGWSLGQALGYED
jgi:recombination protein RecA